jgi:hypothetical protein
MVAAPQVGNRLILRKATPRRIVPPTNAKTKGLYSKTDDETDRQCRKASPFAKHQSRLYLKKFLVDFLDIEGIFDPASDVLANHERREVVAIYQDNPFAQEISGFLCRI